MRNSTKRFYSILVSIALIVGSMFIYASYIRPMYAEIQQLRGERLAEMNILNDAKAAIEIVTNLLRKYEDISEIEDRLSLSLPIGEETTNLLNQIHGLARINKVQINTVTFQYLPIEYVEEQSLVSPVGSLRITAQINGDYESIKSFLRGIETNIRIIHIQSLLISGGGGTRNPILSGQLVVDAYYQVPKK